MIFFPALIFGLSLGWRILRLPCWLRLPRAGRFIIELLFGGALLFLTWYAFQADGFCHVHANPFYKHPFSSLIFLAVAAAVWWCSRAWGARRGAWSVDKIAPSPTPHIPGFFCCASDLLAVFLVAAIFLGSILDEKELYVGHPHFMVVFNPVVQVLQGKALLINAVSQYGLYPDFLRPVFALSGLSVLKFTALIGLLTALSFAALWLVLKKAIHHRAIAVIGFLALVGNTWLNRLPDPARESLVDLYYQYFPIRFLFPALAVLLAWKYFQCPSRWLYWFLTVLLATGILWNFDAGVPSFLAWVSALCYAALFESGLKNKVRTIACHGAAAGGALLAVLGAYAGQGFLRFGELPHFQEFWHYQMLFYVSGFYMLPMPFPATWVVVVLVYLSGLAYAAHALSEKKNTPRAHLVFLLSILGAGLFSYYQGRSHPQVLAVCWWPCFPLLAIFLDENLAILGHGSSGVEREPWTESPHAPRPTLHDPSTLHEPFHWISALLLVLVLAGSSCNILAQSRLAGHWIRQHLRLARSAAPSPEDEDVSLLKKVIPAGQEVLVLSPREGLMHLKSGIPSLARFCMFQLLLMEDIEDLRKALERSPEVKVLIEKGLYRQIFWKNHGSNQLIQFFREEYVVIGETTNCYLLECKSQRAGISSRKSSLRPGFGMVRCRACLPAVMSNGPKM